VQDDVQRQQVRNFFFAWKKEVMISGQESSVLALSGIVIAAHFTHMIDREALPRQRTTTTGAKWN